MKLWITIMALFLLIMQKTTHTSGANILSLLPVPSPSHHIWNRALTLALAARGHQVTVLTPDAEKEKVPNLKEILIEGAYERIQEAEFNYEQMGSLSYVDNAVGWFLWGQDSCQHSMGTKAIKKLIELKGKQTFDLIIIDMTLEECFLAIAPIFNNPPIIAVTAYVSPPWYNMIVGNPQILSYISSYVLPYSDHMTFTQRMANFLLHNYVLLYHQFYHMPTMDNIVRKHFGDSSPVPSEIIKNVSLVMVNTHFSFDYPRPAVPALIEVGGIQVKPGKELPKDIKKFLDEAEHGAIFFSLGTNIRSDKLSEGKLKEFLAAFSELPQRVLWKWESDTLPNQPKNVMVRKWLPQNDILAHPNVHLFLSHAGMLSSQEALYHGVPVVGIPFMADQFYNIFKLSTRGLGELLVYDTATKESILKTMRKVLNNPSYRENMKKMSILYRDQPETPLERAVFWAEYVIRHKGAPHLRSRSADMPFYEYLLFDVIGALIGVVILVLVLLCLMLRKIYKFFVPARKNKKTKKQ